MAPPSFTIAFSSHRSETLPRAEALMSEHQTIVVEEAPGDGSSGCSAATFRWTNTLRVIAAGR